MSPMSAVRPPLCPPHCTPTVNCQLPTAHHQLIITQSIEGVDDAAEFTAVRRALSDVGIGPEAQASLGFIL